MNELERRLHHAARELRAIDIEPPQLAAVSTSRRAAGFAARVPALVMPALFVLGGLAVIVGGLGRTTETPDALPAPPSVDVERASDERPEPDVQSVVASPGRLTAHQEVALIAALAPRRSTPGEVADPPVSAPVRNDTRSYR